MKKLFFSFTGSSFIADPGQRGSPGGASGSGQDYTVQADDTLSVWPINIWAICFAWPIIWDATNAKAKTDKTYQKFPTPT